MLYLAAGLLIGEIFCKFNLQFFWGFFCVPLIIVINVISKKKRSDIVLLILLFLFSIFAGSWLYENKLEVLGAYDEINDGQMVYISGKVNNIWDSKNGLSVEIKILDDGTKAICYFDDFEYEIGKYVTVVGEKKAVDVSTNPGEFDVKEYYNSKEIFLVMRNCQVVKSGKAYSEISHLFFNIRQNLKKAILNICGEEEAGVICAMLFGDKENLDEDIKELYTMSGIGHILAISGLHISLAGGMIYKFMRRFCRQPVAFMVSSGIMLCFCAISGGSVSTVRAVIMYIINIFSHVLGRKYDIKNAMAIALIWVLMDNPLYINNGGFILSFMSVAGIAFALPVVNVCFEQYIAVKGINILKLVKGKKVSELVGWVKGKAIGALITSTVLYFVTLIVIADTYYEVPVYSVILNALLLPLMGLIVISGFLGGIAFYIAKPLGEIVILLSVIILKLYKLVCGLFMHLPMNTYVAGDRQLWQIVVYYVLFVILLIICAVMKRNKCGVGWMAGVLSVGIIAMLALALWKKGYEFNVTVLDVGQGDCIYIESPDGNNYLIDGGSTDEKSIGEYKLEPFLKYRGREGLTAVFVTHTDTDHISGVLELMESEKIDIQNIVFGAYMPEKNDTYVELYDLAVKKGIEVHTIEEGKAIGDSVNGVELLCLNPIAGSKYEDINGASIVLLGSFKEFSFLLTGDIGSAEEKALLTGKYKSKLDNLVMLKVAHHGSKYSSCSEFLEVIQPCFSVISAGEDNSYGHPHEETIVRLEEVGSRIFVTKDCGAVSIKEKEGEIYIECGVSPTK